jgi:putative addiction module killer protein
VYEILHYLTVDGHDRFSEWLADLADRQARARILTRLGRVQTGNFGDAKPIRYGVSELRIDWGPGYRVYYARVGSQVILLLISGDKRAQAADIETAIDYWNDWKRRNGK